MQPHDHQHVLGRFKAATQPTREAAIKAAGDAAPGWRAHRHATTGPRSCSRRPTCWPDRGGSGINAATMLGQSKTAFQAEIDAACELIDFWRFNVHFAKQILTDQPIANSPGIWNRTDHRPLEGFVYAITPFNFTAIAGNLPTAPALMGNTVIWKPAPTQQLAASLTMELLEEAGLPPGVINMLPGHGIDGLRGRARPPRPGRHPLHRLDARSSTTCGRPSARTSRPTAPTRGSSARPAARTSSSPTRRADPDVVRTALIRGAFEYQGQKCSAASRAYVAKSVWNEDEGLRSSAEVEALPMGDVTDFSNFMGAVIDDRAFAKHKAAITRAKRQPQARRRSPAARPTTRSAGSSGPTVVQSRPTRPTQMFTTEYFGPILAVHVYDDGRLREGARQLDGVVRAVRPDRRDHRPATAARSPGRRSELRFAAGNFYINDKPTGAVVGQQPFGGARASGTNDKAGAAVNLLRWTSPRSIKETFVPPTDYRYPLHGLSEDAQITPSRRKQALESRRVGAKRHSDRAESSYDDSAIRRATPRRATSRRPCARRRRPCR